MKSDFSKFKKSSCQNHQRVGSLSHPKVTILILSLSSITPKKIRDSKRGKGNQPDTGEPSTCSLQSKDFEEKLAGELPSECEPPLREASDSDISTRKRKASIGQGILEKYSLDNLLMERSRLGEPKLRVSEREIEQLLRDSDDNDSAYEVEDCISLLVNGSENINATEQLKRIIKEDQRDACGPTYRFFHVPNALSYPEFEDDYSFKVYLSTNILQPKRLTETDCRQLCQIVLYHSSSEIVEDTFLVLVNGLRCCPSFKLNLPAFVHGYLKTLGAVTEDEVEEGGIACCKVISRHPQQRSATHLPCRL
ncbi:hypothetical protein DSO57_1030225 [Entomophthora muscae]|uniref:Uncharacterized protein n=1 Tax=Entomophthora muscae TaxID=34485 RepID=A0ACC2T138_9FUNG|nr:hypothetical protein DSO57_1030225 [Entomophthora muscae]